MACPHSLVGDPRTCSQCCGATPRKVWRDEDSGVLMVDGVPQDRPFVIAPTDAEAVHYKRGAAASGRAKRKPRGP